MKLLCIGNGFFSSGAIKPHSFLTRCNSNTFAFVSQLFSLLYFLVCFSDAKVWQTSKPHNRLVMSFCIPYVGRPYTILVVYGIDGWEKSKLSQKQKTLKSNLFQRL